MAVIHPRQERGGLLTLVAVERRRRLAQLGDEVGGAAAHRRPVLDGGRHLAQDVEQPLAEPLQLVGTAVAIDLDVDERLRLRALVGRGVGSEYRRELTVTVTQDADNGMDLQVDAGAVGAELHGRRVHEERHVVADELDDRVP